MSPENPVRAAFLAEHMESMCEFAEELFMLGVPFARAVREIYEFAGFVGIAPDALQEIRHCLLRAGYITPSGQYVRNP